jgi:hypothetical protein
MRIRSTGRGHTNWANSYGTKGGHYALPASCCHSSSVYWVVPPLSTAAGMGGLVRSRVRGRSGAANGGGEPTPVEGLLSRSDRTC